MFYITEALITMAPTIPLLLLVFAGYETFYINLDSRVDRKDALLSELSAQHIPNATRIQAVKAAPFGALAPDQLGALGCSLSHTKALRAARASVVLVLEDDITFLRRAPTLELTTPSFAWDVLVFAYNGRVSRDCVEASGARYCRVNDIQTTSMYAVRKPYVANLVMTWNVSINGLRANGPPSRFAGDQTWKVLQQTPGHNWFAVVPRVAIQRPGFSDIESAVKNYGVR